MSEITPELPPSEQAATTSRPAFASQLNAFAHSPGNLAALALFICAMVWALMRWTATADFLDFGDEAMRYVVANQLAAGDRLYLDIFDQWGPGTMILSWLAHTFGADSFPEYRIIMLFLMLGAAASLLFSPAWKKKPVPALVSAGLFLAINATLAPAWLGHMLLYQTVGGYLALIAIALVVLPLLMDRPVPRWAYATAGAVWMATLSTALSYAPASLMFAAVVGLLWLARKLTREQIAQTVIWTLAGAGAIFVLLLVWMFAYGDIAGFYWYHVEFNAEIFSHLIYPPLDALSAVRYLARALTQFDNPDYDVARTLAGLAMFGSASIALAAPIERASLNRFAIIFAVGILFAMSLYLNLRGGTMHHPGGTFIVWIGLFAIAMGVLVMDRRSLTFAAIFSIIPLIAITGLYNRAVSIYGIGITNTDAHNAMSNTDNANLSIVKAVQAVTDPDEHILAYEFLPSMYLYADRLPANGHVYLLQGQMQYVNAPLSPDYNIDPCVETERNPPPAIVMSYWDAMPIRDFGPCFVNYVETHYIPVTHAKPRLLILPNRLPRLAAMSSEFYTAEAAPQHTWMPGEEILPGAPVGQPILIGDGESVQSFALNFATWGRTNEGDIIVRWRTPEGALLAERTLPAADVIDREYLEFALTGPAGPGRHMLEIEGANTQPGHGVSPWTTAPARLWMQVGSRVVEKGVCITLHMTSGADQQPRGCQ